MNFWFCVIISTIFVFSNQIMESQKWVIVVAGGTGSRMQTDVPKQFLELCGRPVLIHSIMAFAETFNDIRVMVVLPASQTGYWQQLCNRYRFTLPHEITEGGATRFHSVKNGLSLLPEEGLVAIHDGARPLVSRQTITNCFCEAATHGNAVPVTPVVDSVREITETDSRMLNRSALRLIQTPQVFDIAALKKAYQQEYTPSFTDDASVFEKAGFHIHLTEGNAENIKITTPYDLMIAKTIASSALFSNQGRS